MQSAVLNDNLHAKLALTENAGRADTNASQFFICCERLPELEGKHVVFGKVVSPESECTLDAIKAVGTMSGAPMTAVKIVECGQVR